MLKNSLYHHDFSNHLCFHLIHTLIYFINFSLFLINLSIDSFLSLPFSLNSLTFPTCIYLVIQSSYFLDHQISKYFFFAVTHFSIQSTFISVSIYFWPCILDPSTCVPNVFNLFWCFLDTYNSHFLITKMERRMALRTAVWAALEKIHPFYQATYYQLSFYQYLLILQFLHPFYNCIKGFS